MTINKFIMRLHTAETEALFDNDPASWTLQRGLGGLERISIIDIKNPFPEVKTSSTDVPGVNGALDATEAAGAVFYKNKPVQITLQTFSKQKPFFSGLLDAFLPLHGRVVDFAFDTPTEVQWYHTGRLAISDKDETTGKLTLKIDTEPFLKRTKKRSFYIPLSTSIDRSSSGWSVSTKPSSATVTLNQNNVVIYGGIGDVIWLTRSASASKRFAFAVRELKGGDYDFGDGNKTLGVPGSTGTLTMKLTIDGSYYGWTTENSSDVFKPCLVLDYLLAEIALTDGEIPGADGYDGDEYENATVQKNAVWLPCNARIRPELASFNANADVLLDGQRIYVGQYSANREIPRYPGAVLPGERADRSEAQTLCILSAVGNSANDEPSVRIRFREEKLG